jgi:Bacterial aa3 type cytochrome c oxidase subunit IV
MSWEESTSGQKAQHDPMYKSHLATYHDFVKLVGLCAATTALTLVVLAIILL